MSRVKLTDTEREALRTAIRVDLYDTCEPALSVVGWIVRARMAEAWDEGKRNVCPDPDRCWCDRPHVSTNPYRDEEPTA